MEEAEAKRAAAARKADRAMIAAGPRGAGRGAKFGGMSGRWSAHRADLVDVIRKLNHKAAERSHAAVARLAGPPRRDGSPDAADFAKGVFDRAWPRPPPPPAHVASRVRSRALGVLRLRSDLIRQYTEMKRSWESSMPKKEKEREARLRRVVQPTAGDGSLSLSRQASLGASSSRSRSFGSFDVVRRDVQPRYRRDTAEMQPRCGRDRDLARSRAISRRCARRRR